MSSTCYVLHVDRSKVVFSALARLDTFLTSFNAFAVVAHACCDLQATLVRNTTDEQEGRILYEYLAEASVVFPRVFPVM